jgi:hypothetical protein
MLLKKILVQVLKEQSEASVVLEFPKEKFSVSVDKNRKKLIFSPLESQLLPNGLRTTVLMLKRNFNVISVNSADSKKTLSQDDEVSAGEKFDINSPNVRGVIVVEFDPRENIDKVVEFLSRQVE